MRLVKYKWALCLACALLAVLAAALSARLARGPAFLRFFR